MHDIDLTSILQQKKQANCSVNLLLSSEKHEKEGIKRKYTVSNNISFLLYRNVDEYICN
jgi:hypothetical protein